MGFENFTSEINDSGSKSKGKSSSPSSSSSGGGRTLSRKQVPDNASENQYPFYYEETPQAAIVRTGDGLEWTTWPDTPTIRWAKFSPDDDWEKEDTSHIKRIWYSNIEFQRIENIVEKELNADLRGLLKDDVEKGDDAIQRAINQHGWSEQQFSNSRNCGVCGEEIDLTYGDYEGIGTSIVCDHHTAKEMSEAGIF